MKGVKLLTENEYNCLHCILYEKNIQTKYSSHNDYAEAFESLLRALNKPYIDTEPPLEP